MVLLELLTLLFPLLGPDLVVLFVVFVTFLLFPALPEEVDRIVELVEEILDAGTTWVDSDGKSQPVTLEEILIIAPYNVQVNEISDRLPDARVATRIVALDRRT